MKIKIKYPYIVLCGSQLRFYYGKNKYKILATNKKLAEMW